MAHSIVTEPVRAGIQRFVLTLALSQKRVNGRHMSEDRMLQFYESRGTYPECQAGWYRLILDLDAKIGSIEPGYKVDQIKEKFGGLRFYYDEISVNDDNRERVDKLVDAAEQISYTTCEVCGVSDSTVTTSGPCWVKTLCSEHRK
ncbi:hypothetical protein [Brevibacterium linens]|jgi:hypothetical protein|uniref:hypothetical protein n=1 Tax=Brevibacterium linens TaxID=1703 RepID=UPI000FC9C864|nr:hypothetical protein [Brevibacterium linens]AZT99951.1 hypothetical protein CXR29_03875 [Brevibacterium linens]